MSLSMSTMRAQMCLRTLLPYSLQDFLIPRLLGLTWLMDNFRCFAIAACYSSGLCFDTRDT
jgi:hypothetical protein